MQWAWAGSLEQGLRSPAMPLWIALAAGGAAVLVLLVALLRAEKSLANGVLAAIALMAGGLAVATLWRAAPETVRSSSADARSGGVSLAALACLDGLAGEQVEAACEQALFGSADAAAAAVSYAAAQVRRLERARRDASSADPDRAALERTLARDRYGVVAQALAARDGCTPSDCAAFALVADPSRIKANLNTGAYDAAIARYAAGWGAQPAPPSLAGLPPSVPTGKPTTAEFPSSASIPPVNIMTAEPPPVAAPTPRPSPAAANAQATRPAPPAKKQPTATPSTSPQSQPQPRPRNLAPPAGQPADN